MSRILRYPHLAGPLARLPDCFKKQWLALHRVKHVDHLSLSPPIVDRSISLPYYTPGFSYDIPPKTVHPPEADRCLWNGDEILSGYVRKNEKSQMYLLSFLKCRVFQSPDVLGSETIPANVF
ncbi:unnamed protein product [Dicrocoelium dendriticum]|nr:unnamed protein product [Dicrocoelium dendriticum]